MIKDLTSLIYSFVNDLNSKIYKIYKIAIKSSIERASYAQINNLIKISSFAMNLQNFSYLYPSKQIY